MKTRTIILAGGEGTRLGVLTARRAKPAVPFGGKFRIIDFPLSNCVNSNLVDVMIVAQYRPHSLIEHIGGGGPWDLDREFSGGVRIYTPYRAQGANWFVGTADAVQQNFTFIKRGNPDLVLILSGDHIYKMNYAEMIRSHLDSGADLTMATIQVPLDEASRFGVLEMDGDRRVRSFWEKPKDPPSTQANMGVYLFNIDLLDECLWEDHMRNDSTHDFGKDIIPRLIAQGARVFAYPFNSYWIDVGTVESYWQAHMDLLPPTPRFDLFDRSWVIHTRSEERPPAMIHRGAEVIDCLVCDGVVIEAGARVVRSVLAPGVQIQSGSVVMESIVLTDTVLERDTSVMRAVLDKRVIVHSGTQIGECSDDSLSITMIGRETEIPAGTIIEANGRIGPFVVPSDFPSRLVKSGEYIQTRRLPHEI